MQTQLASVLAVVFLTLAAVAPVAVSAADPDLPPGLDPGGTAIAIISTGLDYTDPEIAPRLARDGEGQLISWDFVDNDSTPFSRDKAGTKLAKLLLETDRASRLIVVRVSPGDTQQFANALGFVGRTPAIVVAATLSATSTLNLGEMKALAALIDPILVVLPGTNSHHGVPAPPDEPTDINVVVAGSLETLTHDQDQRLTWSPAGKVDAWVSSPDVAGAKTNANKPPISSAQATVLLAAKAGCLVHQYPGLKYNKAFRATLLAQARPHPTKLNIKVHDPKCVQVETDTKK